MIYHICPNTFPVLFLDNNNIFISGESINHLTHTINAELNSMLKVKKLSLKTQLMVFSGFYRLSLKSVTKLKASLFLKHCHRNFLVVRKSSYVFITNSNVGPKIHVACGKNETNKWIHVKQKSIIKRWKSVAGN